MNNLKKVGWYLIIVLVLVVLSASFKGNDILERSVIIGIGVDYDANGVLITAEVVSPGDGQEQLGTFSKVVSAVGPTCADALTKLAQYTGKEASLGQTTLLVFGQEFATTQNVKDVIEYFLQSDEFRVNSAICCCKGSAKDFLSNSLALEQSVSISLSQTLLEQTKQTALPTTYLLKFARSQVELYHTGAMSMVEFVPSSNTDDNSSPQGFISCDRAVAFRNYQYVCTLDSYQTKALALLTKTTKGETFTVQNDDVNCSVVVNGKKVDKKLQNDGIQIELTLFTKLAQSGSGITGGRFSSKDTTQLDESTISDVVTQATNCVNNFLQMQLDYDVDLIDLHEVLRQEYGSTSEVQTKSMQQIPVSVTVKVQEK